MFDFSMMVNPALLHELLEMSAYSSVTF